MKNLSMQYKTGKSDEYNEVNKVCKFKVSVFWT